MSWLGRGSLRLWQRDVQEVQSERLIVWRRQLLGQVDAANRGFGRSVAQLLPDIVQGHLLAGAPVAPVCGR